MDSKKVYNYGVGAGAGKHRLSNLPHELYLNIAEQMHTFQWFKSLGALAQTCKNFSEIFMPVLYSRRVIHIDASWQSKLSRVNPQSILPDTLIHTKDLEFCLTEGCDYDPEDVAEILRLTPNLKSFRWITNRWSSIEYFKRDQTLTSTRMGIMSMLKEQPRLKSLWIEFSYELPRDKLSYPNRWASLKGFCNLTSLDLYNFYGDTSHITAELAQCLANCQNLRSLGLGLGADVDYGSLESAVVHNQEDDFLEKICLLYHTLYKGRPLNLHTLRLGHGASPFKSELKTNHRYLEKLVRTKELRTLDIYNGEWVEFIGLEMMSSLPIDFELLDDCGSLTYLSITKLNDDVKNWLSDEKRSSIRTILAEDYSHQSQDLPYQLDLPSLSTISIRRLHQEPIDQSVLSNGGPWNQHPVLRSAVSKYTILDNLLNKGSHLIRLRLCIHYETQWDHFCSRLAGLNSLTHLRLDTPFGAADVLSSIPSLPFSNTTSGTDMRYCFAQEISKICPSLRYIMLDIYRSVAWEIIPIGDGVGGRTLRELTYREMELIEIFSDDYNAIDMTAGLPLELPSEGPRRYPGVRWAPDVDSSDVDSYDVDSYDVDSSDVDSSDAESSDIAGFSDSGSSDAETSDAESSDAESSDAESSDFAGVSDSESS